MTINADNSNKIMPWQILARINKYLANKKKYAKIYESGLFDADYYANINPDVVDSRIDLITHYINNGYLENRKPNPIFDLSFYFNEYYKGQLTCNPLIDYLDSNESKQPNLLFIPSYFEIFNKLLVKHKSVLANYLEFCRNPETISKSKIKEFYESLKSGIDNSKFNAALPDISIIIPCYNNILYTLICLYYLLNHKSEFKYEIILVDDNSNDETKEYLATLPGIKYIRNDTNLGFIESCNKAAQTSKAQYLVFLNNDTIILPNWLDKLIATIEKNKDCGIVGSHLLNFDFTTQEAGGLVYKNGEAGNYGRNLPHNHPNVAYFKDVDYVSGASLAITNSLWQEIGGFDEIYKPAYYEDTDLAFKVRAKGYKVYYQPESKIIHFEGITSGRDINNGPKSFQKVNQEKFYQKWRDELDKHPIYNENIAFDEDLAVLTKKKFSL